MRVLYEISRYIAQSIAIFLLCLCASTITLASSENKTSFNLTEIAAGVYVHQGKQVDFDDRQHDDIANIGFIVGDRCVAVIDTGGSVRIGHELLSAIQATSLKPVCYVINTHIHFDHLLGNIVFQNGEVKFVGHKYLADEVMASRAFFLQQFRADLGKEPNEASIVGPDILVDGKVQLDIGNRVLVLTGYKSAHSDSDLTVFDQQTNTLWLSDLLFMQRIPALDGSLKGWLKIIRKLRVLPVDRVVPGHGPVSATLPEAFDAEQHYLQALLSQTRQKIAEGLFMEDIVDTVGAKEKLKWLLYEQHHKRNVTKAFTELEWE